MSLNKSTGFTISIVGLLLFCALTVFLLIYPNEALVLIDIPSIKAFLLLVSALLIIAIGIAIYSHYYYPSTRRIILRVIHYLLFWGTVVGAGPLVMKFVEVKLDGFGPSGTLLFEPSAVGPSSALVIIGVICAVVYLIPYYERLSSEEITTTAVPD